MRIAVITHAFPPSRHANGKRPYYVVKGLLDAGWEVDVYTSNLACDSGFAETLTDDCCRIFRIKDPVIAWLERVKPMRLLYRVSVAITNGLLWPDFYAPWVKKVMKCLRKSRDYDRVLAFVFPPSMYLTADSGGMLDKRWIYDLQESVTPHYKVNPRRSPLQKWRHPRFEKLEKRALHMAGDVVFTADTNRQAYIAEEISPLAQSWHIPYFYDSDVFSQDDEIEASKRFEIRYFGTFDWRGSRSPEVFLKALALFLQKNPNARRDTRFVFYGSWFQGHDALVDQLSLMDITEIRPAVSYEEYLQLVRSSPILLLVVSSEHNLFMPSKIVDYFGAQRPILGFIPRESEMRIVIESAGMGGQAVDELDVEGGAKAIDSLWRRYKDDRLGRVQASSEFWSSDVQISRYLKIINKK